MKDRAQIVELLKDITYMFTELVYERENFSGHYEGNQFQAISIFGNVSYVGDFDPYTYLNIEEGNTIDSHELELIKTGATIKLLCMLAQTIDQAFDSGCDPIKTVNREHLRELGLLEKDFFENSLQISIKSSFADLQDFNNYLIGSFNSIVMSHFKDLVGKGELPLSSDK